KRTVSRKSSKIVDGPSDRRVEELPGRFRLTCGQFEYTEAHASLGEHPADINPALVGDDETGGRVHDSMTHLDPSRLKQLPHLVDFRPTESDRSRQAMRDRMLGSRDDHFCIGVAPSNRTQPHLVEDPRFQY